MSKREQAELERAVEKAIREMIDEWGVIANVVEPDKHLRLGAKLWLVQGYGGADRGLWRGLSRGGRSIEKWVDHRRLGNFRVAWVPEHLRRFVWGFSDKHAAEEQAAWYREYHPGKPKNFTLGRPFLWRRGCEPKPTTAGADRLRQRIADTLRRLTQWGAT